MKFRAVGDDDEEEQQQQGHETLKPKREAAVGWGGVGWICLRGRSLATKLS